MAELTNTLTGQGLDSTGTEAIDQSYEQLNKMLSSMPQIDFKKLMQPQMDQVQARPVAQPPGRLESFAAAFGAPKTAPNLLSQRMATAAREREDKQSQISDLQSKIVGAEVQQLMQKGDFKKALAKSETLAKLQDTLDQVKQKRELEDFKEQEQVKLDNRLKFQEEKTEDAKKLIETRAREMAKGLGFDEKLTLALVAAAKEAAFKRIERNPITGRREVDDATLVSLSDDLPTMLLALAKDLKNKLNPKPQEPGADPDNPFDLEFED